MSKFLDHLSISELQQFNEHDVVAMAALGRKVISYAFCTYEEPNKFCEHLIELGELQSALASEIPPECPHCGKWITE